MRRPRVTGRKSRGENSMKCATFGTARPDHTPLPRGLGTVRRLAPPARTTGAGAPGKTEQWTHGERSVSEQCRRLKCQWHHSWGDPPTAKSAASRPVGGTSSAVRRGGVVVQRVSIFCDSEPISMGLLFELRPRKRSTAHPARRAARKNGVGPLTVQSSITASSSLRILAATMAVTPWRSRSGLSSTMSAPTGGHGRPWITSRTSRVERPPGSWCEIPGA